MSLEYPESPQEILDRLRTDVQNALPESDPFLKASFILALLVAFAGRIYDVYRTMENLQDELFPWSSTGDFTRRWGLFKGIDKNPARSAEGLITVTGTASTIIPIGTTFQTKAGLQYETIEQDYTIEEHTIAAIHLTRIGDVATFETAAEHHYATHITQTVSGADQPEYNISAEIEVTGDKLFDYEVTGSPATPATGIIFSTSTFASVKIRAINTGQETNLESGAQVTLTSPIAGVDNDAYVQFSEVSGGADEETDEEYRTRVLEAYYNPVSHFNVAEIIARAKSVTGVTRVQVEETTPSAGQVTVYFLRDDDVSPIPDGGEVAQVKNEILKIKPAHMEAADVFVNEPALVAKTVNFVFTDLEPDTVNMRTAIEENLRTMFREVPLVGENLSQDAYRSAIFQTEDPNTGKFVESFTLSEPIGDIPILSNEIALLGSIQWNI